MPVLRWRGGEPLGAGAGRGGGAVHVAGPSVGVATRVLVEQVERRRGAGLTALPVAVLVVMTLSVAAKLPVAVRPTMMPLPALSCTRLPVTVLLVARGNRRMPSPGRAPRCPNPLPVTVLPAMRLFSLPPVPNTAIPSRVLPTTVLPRTVLLAAPGPSMRCRPHR